MDQATGPADLALINGVIYTGDLETAARGGSGCARMKRSSPRAARPRFESASARSTQVIDLHGGFAMPGFNDAHLHLGSGGQAKLAVDLEGAKSISEFQQRVRARVAITKPGEWVTGSGWDHTLWNPPNFPDSARFGRDLGRPPDVFLAYFRARRRCQFEGAGTWRASPLRRRIRPAARSSTTQKASRMECWKKTRPCPLSPEKFRRATPAQRRHGIELAMQEATANGLTSIQDYSSWNDFLTYRELKQEGKLTVRVTEWLTFELPLAQLEQMRREGGTADPWLKTGALKGFMDGALGSTTAALLAPYSDDPKSSGILRVDPAELNRMSIERDRAGFQLAFHAIGDRANRVALDAFAAVLAANGPRDRRDRIEHAQIIAPEDFARFASLHVIASMQPSHQTTDMRWAERRFGPERIKGAYAWHTMLNLGVPLAFGTDYPVEVINPMRGLHACVTRELPRRRPAGRMAAARKNLHGRMHSRVYGRRRLRRIRRREKRPSRARAIRGYRGAFG